MTKVFGIGFQKTGTSSLGRILDRLGYSVSSYSDFRHFAGRDSLTRDELWDHAEEVAGRVDAAKDTPWPIFYAELDRAFPGSKFVHVVRDTDAWLASALADFHDYPNAVHRVIYSSDGPKGHEIEWVERYEAHNREVAAHFAGREGDYLRIGLSDLTFETICPFLGHPVIEDAPPRANTRLSKSLRKIWWRFGRG